MSGLSYYCSSSCRLALFLLSRSTVRVRRSNYLVLTLLSPTDWVGECLGLISLLIYAWDLLFLLFSFTLFSSALIVALIVLFLDLPVGRPNLIGMRGIRTLDGFNHKRFQGDLIRPLWHHSSCSLLNYY